MFMNDNKYYILLCYNYEFYIYITQYCYSKFVSGNNLPDAMKITANKLIEYGIKNQYIAENYELHDILLEKTIEKKE